jgi:hypothetical protein
MMWRMKIYAERPAVRLRQLVADGLMLTWVAVGIWLTRWLRDRSTELAEPGRRLERTGVDLADRFDDAGDTARKAPGVGRALAAPFEKGGDAADALRGAGQNYQDLVHDAGTVLIGVVLIVTVLGVLMVWLPPRAWWIRRATSAARLRADPAGRDLLALRALTGRSLRKLRTVGDDPAGGWRRGDPATIDALMALELRGAGLK